MSRLATPDLDAGALAAAPGPLPAVAARAHRPADALWAAGGPLALGVVLGASFGAAAALRHAALLPLVIAGVTAVMVPALYIGASLAGAAPTAGEFGAATWRGLRAFGITVAGLLAPTAFLLATSTGAGIVRALGGAVTAAGAVIALRVFYAGLFARFPDAVAARALFAVWSLVSLGIGAHLYTDLVSP